MKLTTIQAKLKAPKNQFNAFGKYKYRNCEDILEAVKPLLKEEDLSLIISDEIVSVGDRVYVKATVSLYESEKLLHEASAYAREALTKKGMDDAQVTGAASSYARKYALNGLFLIDDTKDADSHNNSHSNTNYDQVSEAKQVFQDNENPWLTDPVFDEKVAPWIKSQDERDVKKILTELRKKYKVAKKYEELIQTVLQSIK